MSTRHWATASLLAAVALAGCAEQDPPGPGTAGPSRVASPAAEIATAVPLESDGYEWRLSVAPDERTALFARSDGFFPQTREASIYEVTRQSDGSWGDPVEVPFVDETTSDIDPHWSPDGTRVWFSSIRDVDGRPRSDVDVWSVERRADGTWGEPLNAGAVNSPKDDLFPSVAADGALWFGSDRGGDGFDLWRAPARSDGTFAAAAPAEAPLTTSSWEFNPALSPRGPLLVFTALERPGGAGKGDLVVSRLGSGGWSDPVPVEGAATSADEYHPSFSPDGDTLFFVRDGDLMQVPAPR